MDSNNNVSELRHAFSSIMITVTQLVRNLYNGVNPYGIDELCDIDELFEIVKIKYIEMLYRGVIRREQQLRPNLYSLSLL